MCELARRGRRRRPAQLDPAVGGGRLGAARRGGRQAGGPGLSDVDVAVYVRTCVTDEPAPVRETLARDITGYAIVSVYARFFEECGFAPGGRGGEPRLEGGRSRGRGEGDLRARARGARRGGPRRRLPRADRAPSRAPAPRRWCCRSRRRAPPRAPRCCGPSARSRHEARPVRVSPPGDPRRDVRPARSLRRRRASPGRRPEPGARAQPAPRRAARGHRHQPHPGSRRHPLDAATGS